MLRFLLDEQLSPRIVFAVHAQQSETDIVSVHHWREGLYLGADDALLLLGDR